MNSVIVDTGPLVALLNRREHHHAWARKVMDTIEPPIFTCDAVLSEACFLLQDADGGPEAVLELVARGIVRSDFHVTAEIDSLRALMKKFELASLGFRSSRFSRWADEGQVSSS